MRDGRLTRTYISITAARKASYKARHSRGIALIPLGDRGRVRPGFHDSEERDSVVKDDKYLAYDTSVKRVPD
jgi:hypothetical protein